MTVIVWTCGGERYICPRDRSHTCAAEAEPCIFCVLTCQQCKAPQANCTCEHPEPR